MKKLKDNFNGNLLYLTGGTRGSSRFVSYDQRRWDRSVEITRDILRFYGVREGTRMVIAQPFAPWAIGEIFSRASFASGASVYSFGLYLEEPAFRALVDEVNPDFICATASNLIRWKLTDSWKSMQSTSCFVAGEPLDRSNHDKCSKLWNGSVINIYGLSEFDTIGVQLGSQFSSLSLVPHFEYALIDSHRKTHELSIDMEGELCIREFRDSQWFETGDYVRVIESKVQYLDTDLQTHAIEFIRRCDEGIILPDGTIVNASNLMTLQQRYPSINRLQLRKKHSQNKVQLSLDLVSDSALEISIEELKQTLFNSNLELLDCFHHGIIDYFDVQFVNESSLFRTPRGKYPLFVNE